MASRHEIVTIDFRANAAKANPAMESLRSSAYDLRQEIEKTKTAIDEGLKTNMPQAELDKLGERLEIQTKKLRSFDQAMATLSKGVGTLSRAIDAFNTGTLDNMSAAFQKASYNAAEVAKKSLRPDSKTYQKDMAELDALQQKNLENLAKYKLRTEQLLNSIETGGKISSQDLKQEGDALRELMQILPHMGREWLEYNQLLTRVTDATKQQADAEKRLKGAIVDVNDARQRATQLNREGVEAAARQHKEAQEEVALREKTIEALEKERDAKQKEVSVTAALAIAKDKEVEKERKHIAAIQERIDNEERDAKKTQTRVEKLNKEAEALDKNAKTSRETAESMKTDLQGVQDELVQVNEELTKMGTNTQATPSNPIIEGVKQDAHEASAELTKLEEKLKRVAETKAEKQKIIDDYEAKYGKTADEQYEVQQKIIKDAQQKDFAAQDEAINKIEQKWEAYWKKQETSAKQFAESIGKTLEELGLNDVTKHLEGPMADKAKSAYRVVAHNEYELGEALSREGELTRFKYDAQRYEGSDSPEAKVIESLQRKYNEYIKSLREAKHIETEYAPVHKALKEEHDAYFTALGELQGVQQVEENLLKEKEALDKKDTAATKQKTEVKQEEVKVEEQSVKTKQKESSELENLIEQNDRIREQIRKLEDEKQKLIETQEQSAKAITAEAEAYKNLTKEQAQAKLEEKQALSTFKNEGGKWQITNREEAQKYLFDAMGEIDASYLGKSKIEGGPEQAAKLIEMFKGRYGIQSDDDTMTAIRELMWGGGTIKQGAINKAFLAFEQDPKKFTAYTNEIKALTDIIQGNTKAADENAAAKQRQVDIESELKDLYAKSTELTNRARVVRNSQTEIIGKEVREEERLTEAHKENGRALRELIEQYKDLDKEKAKAEADKLSKKSTVGYKNGKMSVTNLEEVQSYIIRQMQNAGAEGRGGTLKLEKRQVENLIKGFQERYGWKGEKSTAQELFKQIIQGKDGGLFKKGGLVDFTQGKEKLTIKFDKEAYTDRANKIKVFNAIASDSANITEKVTEATKENTEATTQASYAEDLWARKVKRAQELYNGYVEDLKKKKEILKEKKAELEEIPTTGKKNQELRKQKEREIADYELGEINPLKKQITLAQRSWETAAADYADIKGLPIVVEAQNQEAAATENVTKGKKGKAKATKEAADATKEETKASQEATEQAGKQSAEDKKRQDLLKKKQELEEKETKLAGDIAQKEEEAAGMETKAANKRAEATKAIEEQAGAHEKNNKEMGIAQENMKGLEEGQARLNGKLGEGRKEIAEYNKKIDENAEKKQQAQQKAAQSERLTIDVMTEAVKILEERNRAIEPEGKEWQENTRLIQQYKAELDRLKQQPVLQLMTERMGNIKNLSAEALQETKKFWQAMEAGAERGSHKLEVAAGNLRVIAEEERQRRMEIQKPMRENLNNLSRLSTNDLAETKKYWEIVRDGAEAGSVAYKKAELAVKALNNEENRRKSNAQAQYIHDQMLDLNNLSVSGLAEVKKYWQAMYDGAKKGSDEMKDAEAALKRINALETERSTEALKASASRLNGNLGLMSAGDLRQAIDDAKKYQLTLGSTSEEAKKLAERIVTAEEHIKRYGVEAEREARRQEEADKRAARAARDKADAEMQAQQEQRIMMMQRSMESQRTKLSAEALAETKKYWEAVARGAEEGSVAQRNALTIMQRITDEELRRNKATNERKASILGGDLSTYSEAEVREAIEAGKQLVQTFQVGSDAANELSTKIVNAENHIRQYGVEAERAAQQQAKRIAEMQNQLSQGSSLSLQALKSQEQYWQRLVDDPKTAAESMDEYRSNLQRSIDLQKEVAETTRRYAGEVVTVNDAMRLSNNLTKENIDERIRLAEIEKDAATNERTILEYSLESSQNAVESTERRIEAVDKELAKQRELSDALQEAERLRADLPKAEDDYTQALQEAMKEKREWSKYNDEEIKAKIKIEELNEKFSQTHNLKEQQKIIAERKVAENELAEAQRKSAEQAEKLALAREKEYAAEDKVKKIKEDVKKVMGGRDYETERDKLDDLEGEHNKLAKTLARQKQEREDYSQAVATAQEREKNAAIELAQAEKVSRQSIEEAIAVLEKQQKVISQEDPEYEKQAAALDMLKQRLHEITGEWMSFGEAEEFAAKAGTEGFIATKQQMQQAVQAMERYKDSLIKTIQQKRKAGEATYEEEAKLEKLEKQLKDLKFEQDNFNMSHEKMQQLLSEPTKATDLDELKAAIKRADGELRRMKDSLGDGSKQYQEFAAKVKEAKNQLKEIESQSKATTSAWDKAWSRLKTYVGMYMGFNMAWQRISGAADDILELSDKMGEVRKTTGFTADEVGRLSDNLKKLDTRTDMTGLMEFSSLAGSIGMKAQEQVQGFSEAANMLAVSLPEMGNEASRTLIKIADATGDLEKNGGNVRETLERVGSTIIALRANSAAAAGPITDFVSRVGAVGAQAGISIDQIAALGATVDALGGRVEMSATALSRMIPAIKNNTFEVARAIGMTEKELKGMSGMEQMVAIFRKLHDSVKQFDMTTKDGMNGAADAVENMLGRSVSMQDVMKQLNQQGARAGIVFGLLSQNVDKLEEQLGTAREAYANNVALMNEYNKMNDTAAGKWARLKNQLEEFFVNADAQSWISDVIDWLRKLIDLITEEGPIGRFFRWSLVYLALWKAKWAEAIGTALISLGQFIFSTKQSTAATVADTAAKTADAAATEATAVANEHAAVASGKFNKTMKANVIAAVATAVVALGWALYEYAQKAKKAAKQMDVMADVEKKAREESVKERAELEKLYKVTQDQTASMEERKKALKDMVGDAKYQEYYSKLANESELAAAAASAYKDLSEQILATARARALDAKAEELQRRRIELEDQKKDREDWENKNRGRYRQGQQQYQQQQRYVGRVTGGATAGFQESQIAQRGSAAMKPAIIDEFEGSVRERNRINGEIEQIDKDIDKLKQQVSKLNLKTETGDGGNGGGGGGGNNPYGNYDRVKSDYNDWDANALVNRRKEMLERVRALANGADVQAVLSEDAKFISEAVRKNIKTTKDAIEWYNTERLKIQEALHGKHLTNTGDWMDPKQQKIRKKLMQDDMKAYLEELDAYYTERKTEIDQARNDEEISEAEAWNRNIKNEAEWHRRRAELQIMYSNKHKQIAEDEQQAIAEIIAERTGDDAKYIKSTIANTRKFSEAVKAMNAQGAKEYRKFQGDLDLGSEKDYNKVEKALGKHLKAMEDIINKERPFSGIVDSLQDNLGKMGILTADLGDDAKSAADELVRLTFLMGEAEQAYTMTVDKLLDDMRKHGFKEWADVVSKDPNMQQGLLAMLRQTFDSVQDAIKKESSIIKKHVENMLLDVTEAAQAEDTRLQILQNSVQRANSLIGAGAASERVADKLAIKQIQLQINLQETRIRMLRKRGADAVALLKQEAELQEKSGNLEKAKQIRMDAENIDKSVGLTLTKEQVELDKQRIQLSEKLEESQNRLYTTLREWASLLSSSVKSLMEATHAGDAEYYNELAKLNLTGKGGPGAGTYIVIDNEGTSEAKAHYEYLDERAALERQHEIEQQNAEAEAWKKLMDDLNNKMNDQITDWLNAALQNQALEDNTAAVNSEIMALTSNTAAVNNLASTIIASDIARRGSEAAYKPGGNGQVINGGNMGVDENGVPNALKEPKAAPQQEGYGLDWQQSSQSEHGTWAPPMALPKSDIENIVQPWKAMADASDGATKTIKDNNKATMVSTQSAFAKMTQAANLYGIAYQAMSNDNMSATQKFEMIAIQAAGQAAITSLTASGVKMVGDTAVQTPSVLSKIMSELGPIAGPIAFGAFTALLGGLMGLATSKLAKSKSQIAQVTGASASAGRLSTGLMTYAEGNVNEFTDPATLTPGRSYNVDAADGRTYRAKYTGSNPRTHLTNGPEFHLAGERGREMIIDAGTTREITMNETEIWHAIQTLRNGGHVSNRRGSRRGVRAFADGNVEDFETMGMEQAAGGLSPEMAEKFQASIDRNNDLLERALTEGIKGVFNVYGKGGMVDTYDTAKKNLKSHGERY